MVTKHLILTLVSFELIETTKVNKKTIEQDESEKSQRAGKYKKATRKVGQRSLRKDFGSKLIVVVVVLVLVVQ